MVRRIVSVVLCSLVIASGSVALAQNAPTGALTTDGAVTIPLPARTVNDAVGVSATLLTHKSVSRIFGKEIADTYAVVQLTVTNRNREAAFVLQSAYLDISKWALGGAGQDLALPILGPHQASTRPNQIASVESRLARGQLLDAQMWSKRNWTMRALTLTGAIASAVVFNTGTNTAKYIAGFNGTVVPGVAVAWPDGTVGQLNRISDFGFQTNKVFPKESADIIVGFFPMDLFLSPGFKTIFRQSPALFLSPYQILFTKENAKAREIVGLSADPNEKKNFRARAALVCFPQPVPPPAAPSTKSAEEPPKAKTRLEQALELCPLPKSPPVPTTQDEWIETLGLLDYIGRFGANNIQVVVDGVMTVELDYVPAAIDEVTVPSGDASVLNTQAFWAPGDHTLVLKCRYCGNGQVSIQEAAKLGITDVKVLSQKENRELTFSYKLTKPIDNGTVLHFVITKPSSDPKNADGIKSTPKDYTVAYTPVAPTVASMTIADKKITLQGTNLDSTASRPIALTLSREGGAAPDKPLTWPADATASTAVVAVPDGLAAGCWNLKLTWTNQTTELSTQKARKVLALPVPTLTAAARKNTTVTVTGTQLVDTTACSDKSIAFEFVGPADKVVAPTATTFDSKTLDAPMTVTLTAPNEVTTGAWAVRIKDTTTKVDVK